MGAVENDEPPCAEVEGVVRAGKPQLLEGECLAEERIAFQPGVAKPPSPDVVVADAVVDGQRILRLKDSVEGVPLRLGAASIRGQGFHDAVAGVENRVDMRLEGLDGGPGPGESSCRCLCGGGAE